MDQQQHPTSFQTFNINATLNCTEVQHTIPCSTYTWIENCGVSDRAVRSCRPFRVPTSRSFVRLCVRSFVRSFVRSLTLSLTHPPHTLTSVQMTDSVRRSQLPLLLVVRWSLTRVRSLVVVSLCVRCWFVCVRCWFVVGSLLRCCRCCVALRLFFVLRSSFLVCCWQLAVGSLAVVVVVVVVVVAVVTIATVVACWLLVTGYWSSLGVVVGSWYFVGGSDCTLAVLFQAPIERGSPAKHPRQRTTRTFC